MIVLVNLGEKDDLSMRSVQMFDRSVSYRLGAETYGCIQGMDLTKEDVIANV